MLRAVHDHDLRRFAANISGGAKISSDCLSKLLQPHRIGIIQRSGAYAPRMAGYHVGPDAKGKMIIRNLPDAEGAGAWEPGCSLHRKKLGKLRNLFALRFIW